MKIVLYSKQHADKLTGKVLFQYLKAKNIPFNAYLCKKDEDVFTKTDLNTYPGAGDYLLMFSDDLGDTIHSNMYWPAITEHKEISIHLNDVRVDEDFIKIAETEPEKYTVYTLEPGCRYIIMKSYDSNHEKLLLEHEMNWDTVPVTIECLDDDFQDMLDKQLKYLTLKEREALYEAVSVIWLNDNSDYINGLWDVIRAILGHDLLNHDKLDIDDLFHRLCPDEES